MSRIRRLHIRALVRIAELALAVEAICARRLYDDGLVCSEFGHEYERRHESTVSGSMNSGPVEECRRCGKRRMSLNINSTDTKSGATISTTHRWGGDDE